MNLMSVVVSVERIISPVKGYLPNPAFQTEEAE